LDQSDKYLDKMKDYMLISATLWEALLDEVQVDSISARLHECKAEWHVRPRIINDEMLHLLHCGEVEFIIGGKVVQTRPRQLIYCPPGVEWQARRTSATLVQVTVIHFQARFPGGHRYMQALDYPFLITPPQSASLKELSDQLCRVSGQPGPGQTLKKRSLLLDIMYHLFACRGQTPATDSMAPEGELVWKVMEFLRQHMEKPITREILARHFSLSPHHLATLFQRQTRCSVMNYLQRMRLEEARRLLTTTSLPIASIAPRVGYEDAAYFSRLFKKDSGVSPLQFRDEQRLRRYQEMPES
jgi:AraC-like DNA-binding protein